MTWRGRWKRFVETWRRFVETRPRGKKLTDAFVGFFVTSAGVAYIWIYLSSVAAVLCSVIFLYEMYTVVNEDPEDTISETIWRASDESPLVPIIGAGAFTLLLAEGTIKDLHVVVPLSILVGHFWFPRYGRQMAERRRRQGERLPHHPK